jgi:hypothetical protein
MGIVYSAKCACTDRFARAGALFKESAQKNQGFPLPPACCNRRAKLTC